VRQAATGRNRRPARRSPSGPTPAFHALCKLCGGNLGTPVALAFRMDRTLPPLPDRVDPKRALVVLRQAVKLVRSGWVQNFHLLFPAGTRVPDSGPVWPLWRALATGDIRAEYARRVIRRVIGHHDIPGWESHPYRTRGEVLLVLALAIEMCGGRPSRPPRRGGWSISGVTTPKPRGSR